MTNIPGHVWGPASLPAKQLVVLCHGLGANGADLIGLAPYFARALPHAAFYSPDAPEPCDMAPEGRQWFPFSSLDPVALAVGVRRAAVALNGMIDAELARLGVSDYALLGFSQGAMTVLFTGLRRSPGPKAMIGYAGALIAPETLPAEIKSKPPVLLVHGTADQVVPAFRSRDAAATMQAAGVKVETIFTPGLAHGIDDAGLEAGARVLEGAFK
jgi:phospholipase/carboxylesterase